MMEEQKRTADSPALPTDAVYTGEAAAAAEEPLPEWKVSGIFSSHMVLQRARPITVWGWCSHCGAPVTGSWGREQVTGTVGPDGRFALTFAPREASMEPTVMTVASAWGSDTFEDILVGDVWVIGGQSNAEHHLDACLGDTPEIAATLREEHPFRLFHQSQAGAIACKAHYHTPARDIICPDWHWQRPGEQAARNFSAIGYYTARLLSEALAQAGRPLPIGVVMMCAGGACLRELMPRELAEELGYTTGANMPVGGYYNTLIAPLLGLQFTGQIFYQGESEGIWKEMAQQYDADLERFVADERRRFGQDFPFYNVQLCSYREEGGQYFPYLRWVRDRQLRAQKRIPRSFVAPARDLGAGPQDAEFAHSPHKYPLAQRLAAQILAAEYGIGTPEAAAFPVPVCAVRQDSAVEVRFTAVQGRLKTADGGALTGFSLENGTEEPTPVPAELTGPDTVRVTLPEGECPAEIGYAMTSIAELPQANLLGGTGLPAPSFLIPIEDAPAR